MGRLLERGLGMKSLTDHQREILSKLVALAEQIEAYKATLHMLEHQRFSLQTELQHSGWTPEQVAQGELL